MRKAGRRMKAMSLTAGIGLGLAIAAAVTLLYRSAPFALSLGLQSVKPLVIGIGTGGLLAGSALMLVSAKEPFAEPSEKAPARLAGAAICCILLSTCLFLADLDVMASIGSMPVACSGILGGIGGVLFFFSWQQRFSRLPAASFFPTSALALIASGVVCGTVALLPFAGAVGVSGAALAASFALCWKTTDRRKAADTASSVGKAGGTQSDGETDGVGCDAGEGPSFGKRVRQLVAIIWKPVLGSCICAFVIGFTWDTDLIGVPLNNTALLASEKIVGFVVAGALLLVLSHARSHERVEVVLLYTILPLALFTFIVRPYFLGSNLPTVALMLIGIARETGFVLFFTAAWYAVCTAPRKTGASLGFTMGIASSACCLLLLFGFGGTYAFGSAINMMGAVLFIVYLIAIAVSSTIDARANRKPLSAEDVEGFLEARANAIGDRYGLSPREREILLYLTRGHSYASIADQLFISENTLRTHARNIYRKVDVKSREGLITLLHENEDR